jgi:flavin-dependent dehydrogenase
LLRIVRLRQGGRDHDVAARVVIAAGGLGSKLDERPDDDERNWTENSRIGTGVMIPAGGADYEPGVIYMACSRDGYVGQVVVEDGRIDVAAALDPMAVKQAGGIGELCRRILDEAGFPSHPDIESLPWKGTPHLTRQSPRLGGVRLFTVGDAAGYIEPFTGEGMAWALAGAAAVAPLAIKTINDGWNESLLRSWIATYRREVTKRQGVCRLTAAMLRRPLTTNLLVRTLGMAPWISRPFLRFMYRA